MISNLDFSKNINRFQKVKNLLRCNILKQHTEWLRISYVIYFLGTHPTQTATVLICIYFLRGFRSENGMSSTEMSPSTASLAAEYAGEFPLMPTWPGTKMKTTSLPSLVVSVYNSKIWTKTGWYFRFSIDCNTERELDNIKNEFSLE